MIPLRDDNPTSSFPFVTLLLIAANALVFVFELTLNARAFDSFVLRAGAIPYEVTHLVDLAPRALVPVPLTLLSSLFVHGGVMHLLGNMLFLWIFGDNIEDTLGHTSFFFFYIFTGLAASATHIAFNPDSTIPMIGASGAIAGILGAYFLLFPRAHVQTLVIFFFIVRVIKVPALVFLGFWFVFQVLNSTGGASGVAWGAHIGGFAAGAGTMLLIRLSPWLRGRLKRR